MITANVTGNVTGNVSGTAANVTGVVAVANGGSGANTLTGYLKGNGTSAFTAAAAIPVADVTNAESNQNKASATDLGGASSSNTNYPTQLAVKTYVDTKVAAATIPDADASTKGKIQLTGDLGNTAASPTVVKVGGSTASDINTATILANASTASSTANAIVKRDGSGNFSAGTITANLTGTASKATILSTGRTISTTGDVTYTSGSFDGSTNVTGVATLASSGVVSGTYGSSTLIPSLTIDSKGRVTSATTTSIIAGVNTVGSIAASSDAAGATINGTTIKLTPADGTNGGVVTTGTQTFAGVKTFSNNTASTSTSTGAVVVTGGIGIGGAIYGASIQNTPIGSTTASTGAFTTLSTSGASTLGGTLGVTGATTLTSLTTTGAATFSSTVKIPTGAAANKVLTSDASGNATWTYGSSSVSKPTATATILISDKYVFSDGAADGTLTLPAATGNAGKEIIIKNRTTKVVTVTRAGTETIFVDSANNLVTSFTIGSEASNNWVKLVSDGANWVAFRALF